MSDRIDIRDLSKRRRAPAPPAAAGRKDTVPSPAASSSAPSAGTPGRGQGTSGAAQTAGGVWGLLNKDIRLFGSALPDKIKESFYLELGTLLAAGMDIRASLELIRNEQPKKKYREFFDVLLERVVTGMTLSSAMKAADLFTPYEFFSVRIGEETGKLVIVLNELAIYYKKKIDQKRQIVGALTYPILVMVVAVSAVSFMMAYVVPMFADVLKRFGGDLPLITRMVLRFSRWITASGPLLLLLPAGVAAVLIWQRKATWFRKYSSSLILRIPVIGDIIRKIYLSRFANTMALLIGSRIPMLQAIQLIKQMVSFYPIESSLSDVEEQVLSGTPLHSSLGRHPIYPRKMISLVKVGEEVNQLDVFFSKISTQYSGEVEYRTNLLSKFLEPLIIVVLGLVVGVILIAMYLPLFKLGQAV